MAARTFPPENATNKNSAGATRATRRRPDIGFGKPLSSKEVAVERYVSRLGQSPEIAGGKPYVAFRSTGRGGRSGPATISEFHRWRAKASPGTIIATLRSACSAGSRRQNLTRSGYRISRNHFSSF